MSVRTFFHGESPSIFYCILQVHGNGDASGLPGIPYIKCASRSTVCSIWGVVGHVAWGIDCVPHSIIEVSVCGKDAMMTISTYDTIFVGMYLCRPLLVVSIPVNMNVYLYNSIDKFFYIS